MRDLVARPSFWIRKKLDQLLNLVLGSRWIPLYSTVTFSRMRYHKCVENKEWQDRVSEEQGTITYCRRDSHLRKRP
jgi:kynurenine 3-monooxygenase